MKSSQFERSEQSHHVQSHERVEYIGIRETISIFTQRQYSVRPCSFGVDFPFGGAGRGLTQCRRRRHPFDLGGILSSRHLARGGRPAAPE